MKEQLDMIPVNDAFDAGDECPFCWLERKAQQGAMRYVAGNGASYMEPDVRAATDRLGFCVQHMKDLYDYGNQLGSALILQTHFAGLLEELEYEAANVTVPKKRLFSKKQPAPDAYHQRLQRKVDSCYLCDRLAYNMNRYYHTFFVMLKDPAFRAKVESSKGFCLRHFATMLQKAEDEVPSGQREWFYNTVYTLEKEQLTRVKMDLDWFIAKFVYRNAGADWKNSWDALSRSMQKLQGLYPADPPYKKD